MEGELALCSVHMARPDLILLDIIMPDMDGFEVCRRLKADERTQDIPIIFLSAIDEVFDKVSAFSLGGVDYVTKPFAVKEVLARIDTHIKLTRLQQTLKEKTKLLQEAVDERKNLQKKLAYYKDLVERIMDKLPQDINITNFDVTQ